MEITEWIALIRDYLPEIVIAVLCVTVVHLWRALRRKDAQMVEFLFSILRGARPNGSARGSADELEDSQAQDSSRERGRH